MIAIVLVEYQMEMIVTYSCRGEMCQIEMMVTEPSMIGIVELPCLMVDNVVVFE